MNGRVAAVEDRQTHRPEVRLLLERATKRSRRDVALLDLIDVDVTPWAGLGVDDLDADLFARKITDVPGLPVELFLVLSGGSSDDFAVQQQVDAGLARMVAAADQEADVFPLNCERRGRQFAL